MRSIILCADDYALNAGVDAGILQLVRMRRLSAVACMTESPRWLAADNPLPALRDHIDIGMHFNLTQPFPGSGGALAKQPLPAILRGALLGSIPPQAIAETLHAQLDRFESVMGDAPDFVDGHQHVQVFPRIRNIVLKTLARRYRHRKPWLRQIRLSLGAGPDWNTRALLTLLNWRFRQAAQRRGFVCNDTFSGVYSLQPQADFPLLMRHWLQQARDGELVICHPGTALSDTSSHAFLQDDIAAARQRELAWLGSADFAALLEQQQIRLTRFQRI